MKKYLLIFITALLIIGIIVWFMKRGRFTILPINSKSQQSYSSIQSPPPPTSIQSPPPSQLPVPTSLIPPPPPRFRGLCMFDIDGTLTTGRDNYNVVQACIDNGYAVGISTAGAMYHPGNLNTFQWMPSNLYNWMSLIGWITFSNVGSLMLMGKPNRDIFIQTAQRAGVSMHNWGWLKGLTMVHTAKALGLSPNSVILFDNDPGYIKGVKQFNPNLRVVCAGEPCGGVLDLGTVRGIYTCKVK